jgi:hypothetical protein
MKNEEWVVFGDAILHFAFFILHFPLGLADLFATVPPRAAC